MEQWCYFLLNVNMIQNLCVDFLNLQERSMDRKFSRKKYVEKVVKPKDWGVVKVM